MRGRNNRRSRKRHSKNKNTSMISYDLAARKNSTMVKNLEASNEALKREITSLKQELAISQENSLQASKALKKEITSLKQELAVSQENYQGYWSLFRKREVDLRRMLRLYQELKDDYEKDKEHKKECGDCKNLRMECRTLNKICANFDHERATSKSSINYLEGMIKNLLFDIKELEKEKALLKQKLFEWTPPQKAAENDALILQYLKKSKFGPNNNNNNSKDQEIGKEGDRKSLSSIEKVDELNLKPSTSSKLDTKKIFEERSKRNSFSNFFYGTKKYGEIDETSSDSEDADMTRQKNTALNLMPKPFESIPFKRPISSIGQGEVCPESLPRERFQIRPREKLLNQLKLNEHVKKLFLVNGSWMKKI